MRASLSNTSKDIAAYRVARGEGVSEDYMIKGTPTLHITHNSLDLRERIIIVLPVYCIMYVSLPPQQSFWKSQNEENFSLISYLYLETLNIKDQ